MQREEFKPVEPVFLSPVARVKLALSFIPDHQKRVFLDSSAFLAVCLPEPVRSSGVVSFPVHKIHMLISGCTFDVIQVDLKVNADHGAVVLDPMVEL